LKSALSDMSMAIPACFGVPFSWNVFFHPVTLRLCLLLDRCISCGQQMIGSYFLIWYASPCLRIGELRPLTFRIMIKRYVVIPDILLVL
jgi:hypothetical protein